VSHRRISLGLGCLTACVLYPATPARAQEALNNALSLDWAEAQMNAPKPQATNSAATFSPEPRRLGPVQYSLGAYAGAAFTDNINLAQYAPQSDLILSGGVNVGLIWPATPQSELDFSTAIGHTKYLSHSGNDHLDVAPGSVLTWKIACTDGSLTFFDQISDSQAVITEASVSGISSLPRIDNTIGTRAEWDPGRWLLSLGYSHENYFSDAAADQYLNRASEDFFARGGHLLAQDTRLGLEASVSLTAYELPLQSNNTSYSLGPYLEWQITHFLDASVRGGYTIYAFDANGPQQPAYSLDAYYANLTLTQQLTEFVSQTLSVERDISLGLSQGNNYTEQWTAGYTVNWAATAHLGLNLNLTWENGGQPFTEWTQIFVGQFHAGEIPTTFNENYTRVGFSPGLSYQITQKLGGSLQYSHWERTSNFPGDAYHNNLMTLQFNYSF
jgi:hypothetical protein